MADLTILVPSRGRPEQLAVMLRQSLDLAGGSVDALVGLDDDEDTVAYVEALDGLGLLDTVHVSVRPRMSLSAWTNHLAAAVLESPKPPAYLASLGDDHRPRTSSWDRKLITAIEDAGGFGWSYGNDLLQGRALPTAWVVDAETTRRLGWVMLPVCDHMYVDNAVKVLGEATGRLHYVPQVVVEHVHPVAGKTAWDASYRASNTEERYAADRAAFEAWQATQLAADALLVTGA